MENDLLSAYRLLFCGADVYMLHIFFAALFQEKWEKKKNFLFGLVLTVVMYIENSVGSILLNYITIPIFCYIYVDLLFHTSLKERLAYVIIWYSFASGKEALFDCIYRLSLNFLPFYIPPWYTAGGIYILAVEYLFGFGFVLYMRRCLGKLKNRGGNIFYWYLFIFPVLSLIVPNCLLYKNFSDSSLMQILTCCSCIMLFFSNAAIFIILEKYADGMNQVKYAEFSIMKREMEKEHFETVLKLNDRYRCYMHDIKTYLNSLKILALNGEDKKIIDIINGLGGEIQAETGIVLYSGNPVLNAILSERDLKAKEERISLTIFAEKFLKTDFISDADMISMFGNLLDNALEAAVKCSPENRRVNVKLFMGTTYFLIFRVENSFVGEVRREGSRLLSVKKDSKHHGLGIGIVKNLAEKYGGALNLENTENVFVATLTISTCMDGKSANIGT